MVAPTRVRELKPQYDFEGAPAGDCRTHTGAWIETPGFGANRVKVHVAPTRVRELKFLCMFDIFKYESLFY